MNLLSRHRAPHARICVCVLLAMGLAGAANATVFPVGPLVTFIHVRAADSSSAAVIIDLSV